MGNDEFLLLGLLRWKKEKCVTKRRKQWLWVIEIIKLFENAFPCIHFPQKLRLIVPAPLQKRTKSLPKNHAYGIAAQRSSRLWNCGRKWREVCHAHLQAKFALEVKSFATRNEGKNGARVLREGRTNFGSVEARIDLSAMFEAKKNIRARILQGEFAGEIRVYAAL